MDWGRIEGIVYSEESQPHSFLGASVTDSGILVQAFLPSAKSVAVTGEGLSVPMEAVDENGFFAALLPGEKIPDYRLEITQDDCVVLVKDPYNYDVQIPEKALKKWKAGICYQAYDYLGAHRITVDGTKGMYFAVWAPNAVRVSLVGDFNGWDGRVLPMRKLEEYGIFELFVPELEEGEHIVTFILDENMPDKSAVQTRFPEDKLYEKNEFYLGKILFTGQLLPIEL
jgi:1,4-alpha-glucan branching enzyme